MSEFEFLEAVNFVAANLANSAINFFTVFLAYVVAAHFAGKTLSRLVAVCVSIVYTLFLIGPSVGIVNSSITALDLRIHYHIQYPEGVLMSLPSVGIGTLLAFTLVPPLLGWVGSLVYMHAVIRRDN